MHAVLSATGIESVYQLTKQYGRHAYDAGKGASETLWAERRSKLYDSWRAGSAFACKRDGQLTPAALRLVSTLPANAAAAFDETLDWPLWELLDPEGFALQRLADSKSEAASSFYWPAARSKKAWRPRALSELGGDVERLLEAPDTRLRTLEQLWVSLRMARRLEELPMYAICYCLWLNAKRHLLNDPVLGPIADGLYNHAEMHFAQVVVYPGSGACMAEASDVLMKSSVPQWSCNGDNSVIVVNDLILCDRLRCWPPPSRRRSRPRRSVTSTKGHEPEVIFQP